MESNFLGKQLERPVEIIVSFRLQLGINPVVDDPEPQTAHVQPQLMGFAGHRLQTEKPPVAFYFQELDMRAGIDDTRGGFHTEARFAPDDPVFDGPMVFPRRLIYFRQRVINFLHLSPHEECMIKPSRFWIDGENDNAGGLAIEPMQGREIGQAGPVAQAVQ